MGWFARAANSLCTKAGYGSCADLSTFEAILLAAAIYFAVWLVGTIVWNVFNSGR